MRKPSATQADLGTAISLLHQGKLFRAEKEIQRYLTTSPKSAEAHMLLGVVKCELKQYGAAVSALKRAVMLAPTSAEAHYNLGKVLSEAREFELAREQFAAAIELEPSHAESYSGLGNVLYALGNGRSAVDAYKHALEIDPGCPGANFNLGVILERLGQGPKSVLALQRAIQQEPENLETHYLLGYVLSSGKQFRDAIAVLSHVVARDPANGAAAGQLAFAKRMAVDWEGLAGIENSVKELAGRDLSQASNVRPFPLASISDDPALMRRCAKLMVPRPERKPSGSLIERSQRSEPGGRIRLAYVSGDYFEHATSYLIAEMIESHDRERFEVTGISFGPPDDSPMRRRMISAFDKFIDVQDISAEATVELIRQQKIDIAIDLVGHAQRSRMGIFANRAAPVQVNYLGWPATTGANFIDYILGDPIVIPVEHLDEYTEAVVHLPECYQPNDGKRPFPQEIPSRAACGLPDDAIVFCCFNSTYKIGPDTFDAWMRILNDVPGSVLWLLETTPLASENLRREAERRGIGPERLIFAPILSLRDHLARFRQADIFLDTFPYNAHTTASEALWSEVPVVTCRGQSFASRVASSLVHAVGEEELSVTSMSDYEALAVSLASDRDRRLALKARLAAARAKSPLFNAPRLCRHVESAYQTMWDRWQRRLPPAFFTVAADA